MGKRLIIKGANFATNGMKEQYVEKTVTTARGMITTDSSSSNFGKLNTTGNLYSNYVHSNQVITLEPGDTVAMVSRPSPATRMSIFAYTDVTSYYPVPQSDSSNHTIGTRKGFSGNLTTEPVILTNTGTETWYIVLQLNNQNGTINTTTNPTIAYRIYTDHPENYQE